MRMIQMKRSKPRPALNQRRTKAICLRDDSKQNSERDEKFHEYAHTRRPFQLIKKEKANGENASSDEALGKSERKPKLDVEQSYPDLRVQYPSEEEIIKNVKKT